MDISHSLSSQMVVCSFDVKNDLFRLCEKGEELLGYEISYLSIIDALIYLDNCTCPNIIFLVNLLAKYSFTQT